ncbi:MAG: T9SS type A sorting domain-containing protein [Bacteroidetes bacterium]|nr:T9SS C-terminal target domain-containing protein [Bacteroidota bacterium]MCL4815788.1 T9SS type A sorting domain-containing protein [Flavobacteriales bacterium]NOG95019.1 T9SS type A sorting domain-containing protein [Bacteroidota bacterium]
MNNKSIIVNYLSSFLMLYVVLSFNIRAQNFGAAAICNINAVCEPDWCDQRRGVGLIYKLSNGIYVRSGTGSLVNNTRRDKRPYFLTANHIIDINMDNSISSSEQEIIDSLMIVFNYQSNECDPKTPLQEPDTIFFIIGATLIAHHSDGDFALLELNGRIPANYNTYFNGFRNSNEKPDNITMIHHPKSDIKKISFSDKKPKKTTAYLWEVKKWTTGTAETGSSGAPWFNQEKVIVGQQSRNRNDDKECTKKLESFGGRFDVQWDNIQLANRQLKFWLNPSSVSNSQITYISGDEPCKINYTFQNANDLHTSANVSHFGPVFPGDRTYNGVYECTNDITIGNNVTIQSGTSVILNAGNRIVALPGSKSELGSTFHAYIKGCLRGCDNGVGRYSDGNYENYEYEFGSENKEKEKEDYDNTQYSTRIYPNPSNGLFTIESQELINLQQIELYDIFGKCLQPVINQNGNALSLNLTGYAKGMYFIKIGTYSQKIVVE